MKSYKKQKAKTKSPSGNKYPVCVLTGRTKSKVYSKVSLLCGTELHKPSNFSKQATGINKSLINKKKNG